MAENIRCRYVEPGTYGILLRLDEAGFGTTWSLDGTVCVGRTPGCEVVVDEPSVSRRHASIRPRNDMAGGLVVEDHRSANGTRVNARLIDQPTAIRPGDRLHFGEAEMVFLRDVPYYGKLRKMLRPGVDAETGFELPGRATRQIAALAERRPVTAIITRRGNCVIDSKRLARSVVKSTQRAFDNFVLYVRLDDENLMAVLFDDAFDHELKSCLENIRWSPELPHVTAFRFDPGDAAIDWQELGESVKNRNQDNVEIVDFRSRSLHPKAFADWTPPTALLDHVKRDAWNFETIVHLRPWRAHYFRKRLGLAGAIHAMDGLRRVVRSSLRQDDYMAYRDDQILIALRPGHGPPGVMVAHLTDAWRSAVQKGWISLEWLSLHARDVPHAESSAELLNIFRNGGHTCP